MSALTAGTASKLRAGILGLSTLSLSLVFQPFSLTLFGLGCGAVFVSAMIFNLMPFLRAGQPVRAVMRASAIILLTLAVTTILATLSAWFYILHLQLN